MTRAMQPTAIKHLVAGDPRSGGSSSHDRAGPPSAHRLLAPADTDNASDAGNVVANEFVNKAPTIRQWLASPRAVAGRAGATASTVSTQTSLWTPPRFLTGRGSDQLHRQRSVRRTFWPPCSATCSTRSPEIHRTAPTPDTPLSWMLLGAARRQIGVDSFTSQSLLAPADSITYDAGRRRWSTVS